MTEKLTELNRSCSTNSSESAGREKSAVAFGYIQPWQRRHFPTLVLTACLLLSSLGLATLHAKPKTDKFQGTVVVVGPKAITVKSLQNIYLVRTFRYSAELEKKLQRHKPEAGKKVTVHYVRGTDLALKVD